MTTTTSPNVIDVSHWQDDVDFAAMKKAGILGVIFKATEGTSYTDPTYASRKADAAKAGLVVSSYHFLKHGSIDQQMRYFLSVVKPKPGERVVVDYEDDACTLTDLTGACQALQQLDETLQITVYGANGFLGAQLAGKRNSYLSQFSLWVASYTSNPAPTMTDLSATWPHWALWQYSDKISIAGHAPMDVNRFNGTDENCLKWLAPAPNGGAVPAPSPSNNVTLTIDAEQPTAIHVLAGPNVTLSIG